MEDLKARIIAARRRMDEAGAAYNVALEEGKRRFRLVEEARDALYELLRSETEEEAGAACESS